MTLFRRSWANLFPSPKEGWGITVVEAGACGTPSLASDSPGLRDSVRHELTGYLVPHGDAGALAERMLQLAADPALVERLGAEARRFAEAHSWDRTADATEVAFAGDHCELAAGRKRSSDDFTPSDRSPLVPRSSKEPDACRPPSPPAIARSPMRSGSARS